jgi:hypothetical protein
MQISKVEMKTHCVGRHLIDMPISFSATPLTIGSFKMTEQGAEGPSVDVTVHAGLTPSQFAKQVQKRLSELRDSGSDTADVFRLQQRLSDQATIFRVQRIDDAYVSEINFLTGTSWVIARLKSYRNQFQAAEEKLIKFAAAVRANDAGSLDMQRQGFCLGPVTLLGDFSDERARFVFRNDMEKGVGFDMSVDTYREDSPKKLLTRVSGPDSLLSKLGLRPAVLRERDLTVGGMRAQEWLGSAELEEQQNGKSLKFVLETMRSKPARNQPSIHLTYETGQPLEDGSAAPTTIADKDAIQLWDSVVKSIRPLVP